MNRKELVQILGEHFKVKPEYMGIPSFAYQIRTEGETFIIDADSKITNSEGVEFEFGRLLNGSQEEIAKEENFTEDLVLTMEGHTGVSLKNLVNMISSKQRLIKKALELETDIVTAEFVEGINNVRLLTLEDFKVSAEEIGIRKVPGICFDFQKRTLTFGFINTFDNGESAIQFAKALNESAKKLKYCSPKQTETDNDKFTFRTWLLRLGFIGVNYKKARGILLKNLEGNGSYARPHINQPLEAVEPEVISEVQ